MTSSDMLPIDTNHPAVANRHRLVSATRDAPFDLDASVATFDEVFREKPALLPYIDLNGFSEPLRSICAATPNNLLARLWLGESLLREGAEAEARSLFVSIIRALRPEDRLSSKGAPIDEAAFRMRVPDAEIWHSIDFGESFIEGRRKDSRILAREMLMMDVPSLTGKTVLDVGAFGGWFTFEAERRGADRVTALEYYSWTQDRQQFAKWITEQRAAKLPHSPYFPPASCYDEARLPGRATFEMTRTLLGSHCDMRLGLLETLPVNAIGVHDVVFYLGVLYHVENPFETVRKLAAVTGDVAIIETLGYCVPGIPDFPSFQFFGKGEVNQDPTTFWAPSEAGLRDMLLAAGFARVEIKYGWNTMFPFRTNAPQLCRIWAHAWK